MSSGAEALRAELQAVRNEIAATNARLDRLRAEEFGLRVALARVAGEPTELSLARGGSAPTRQRLTPLVRALLQESQAPLDRHAIVQRLTDGGHVASPDAVSASLSYLQRQGIARNERGLWALLSSPERTVSDE